MELVRSVIVFYVIVLILITVNNVTTSGSKQEARLLSYMIPEARDLKRALGLNEDSYLNFTELTTKYGYKSEEHTVTTEDGYILTIFKILSKCDDNSSQSYPILLMHGLIDSSDVFIVAGAEFGLGYVLARNCYDVWAVNHRGNTYSRRHISLDPDKDIQFWDYTFDEHGNFDLPASIDYILQLTGKQKLFYMGHSQGTTNFFVMSSLKPEYNKKIQLSIHLAPVAWMTHMNSPVPRALALNSRQVKEILDAAGLRELLAKHQLTHFLTEILCHFAPDAVCGMTYTLSTGLQPGSIKPKLISVAFGHLLSGTSTKNLLHFAQLIVSKKFKRFDEGLDGNMKRYNTRKPPLYNVSQITSPVVLMSARNDLLSNLKDVETLTSKLPNLVENYIVPIRKWSHVNYVYDERAQEYVNPKILEYLKRYNV
ncbi:unnamed protein product [Diatraea saccharalis]|uniref:Lipase n=1 Tax=Diatraea saccharalis TaxID=40085 RepID=A0A9N9W797_9NEOP|nr:unnamed protein product [Diatraea saccharalis]